MIGAVERPWTVGSVAAVVFGAALVLPFQFPIPGLDAVPLTAQIGAVAAAFLLLPVQLAGDAAQPRPGSGVRLAVLGLAIGAAISWAAGVLRYGFALGAALSLVNWVALGALVVAGQVLYTTERRISVLLTSWATAYAVASAVVTTFLISRFGLELLTSTNRGTFQAAGRSLFITWPNYFGTAAAVAACVFYGRILTKRARLGSWIGLFVLLATIIMSFSRTSWVACAVALAVMTVTRGHLRRAVPVVALSALLVVVATMQLPVVRYQFFATLTAGSSQQLSVLERLTFGAEAIRLWWESPLFGIGFRRFDEFANVLQLVSASGRPDVTIGSVHNEYLSVLLKGGLLSGVAFLIFVVVAVNLLRRASRDDRQGLASGYLGIIGLGITTVLLVAGFATESFRTLSVSAPFWVLVGAVSMLQHSGTKGANVPS